MSAFVNTGVDEALLSIEPLQDSFLCSIQCRFSIPACKFTVRRAVQRSRLAVGHRRRRREAVCVLGMPKDSK
jgi:hypothetical protein